MHYVARSSAVLTRSEGSWPINGCPREVCGAAAELRQATRKRPALQSIGGSRLVAA